MAKKKFTPSSIKNTIAESENELDEIMEDSNEVVEEAPVVEEVVEEKDSDVLIVEVKKELTAEEVFKAKLKKELEHYETSIKVLEKAFNEKSNTTPSDIKVTYGKFATELNNITSILQKTSNQVVLDSFLKYVSENMGDKDMFSVTNICAYLSVKYTTAMVDKISITVTAFASLASYLKKRKVDKNAKFNVDAQRIGKITGSQTLAAYFANKM